MVGEVEQGDGVTSGDQLAKDGVDLRGDRFDERAVLVRYWPHGGQAYEAKDARTVTRRRSRRVAGRTRLWP